MLRKLLIILGIIFPLFTTLRAQDKKYEDTPISKTGFGIKRGPRGRTGRTGPQGPAGITPNRVFASAYAQYLPGSSNTSMSTPSGAVLPFNQVEYASGIDASQLVSNNVLIIQTSGVYLVTYHAYIQSTTITGQVEEIALLKNGAVVTTTRTRIRSSATSGTSNLTTLGGSTILNLNANDSITVANVGTITLFVNSSILTSPTPARYASLTIEKLDN
jgi:hypothetical protein